jgi:ribonuclease J
MLLIIHRGTHEIGGTCIELSSGQTRILIDIGRPLSPRDPVEAKRNIPDSDLLPKIPGLYHDQTGKSPIDAIIISHAHQDHYGLLSHVKSDVTVFAGKPTATLMEMSSMFGPATGRLYASRFTTYNDRVPFKVGDFVITPYCMDHSAFDAHAFLIEADGKRLFYSGDFRAHGRKSALFDKFLRTGPEGIDALLLEGTMLSRSPVVQTEQDVENDIVKICRDKKDGIMLAYLSSQNIDRITSFFRAARRTHRIFAVDLYTAWVLSEIKGKTGIPVPSDAYPELKVFYPYRLTKLIVDRMGRKDIKDRFSRYWISRKTITADPSKVILMVRPTMKDDIDRITSLEGGVLAYSLWDGYKNDKQVMDFLSLLAGKGMISKDVHTSGHAPLPILQKMAEKLKPKVIIPVHTEYPKNYPHYFANVQYLKDEENFTF